MPTVAELETPSLLLDRPKLIRNLTRMQDRLTDLGVALRPHMKTAKSVEVARLIDARAIAVSTLAEAEYFASHGYSEIMYAVGITDAKLDRVMRLRRSGTDIQVVVDSVEAAKSTTGHGDHRVWIEVDSDGRRAGVDPEDGALVEIAEALGDQLVGVMTHCGGSYSAGDDLERLGFARMERDAAVKAVGVLHDAGIECPNVSVGSTPTLTIADDLTGVTEARPGVYMFMDLFQSGMGVCRPEDIALSVAATVIGRRRDGVVIDAGSLALSLDRSTASQSVDMGYGQVCDVDGNPISDLIVQRVSQEHGVVVSRSEGRADLPLGTVVRVLPNHACITAAAHRAYQVVEGCSVVDTWDRVNGW